MDDELKAVLLVGAAFLAIIGGAVWAFNSYACSSKWSRSGFQTDYGPIQGCLISKDGRMWLPAENYREVPL